VKIGDKVVCLSIPENNSILKINGVYTLTYVTSIFVNVFESGTDDYYRSRFKKIDDNELNRLLYPEAFNKGN
jgi:hypothetical protein